MCGLVGFVQAWLRQPSAPSLLSLQAAAAATELDAQQLQKALAESRAWVRWAGFFHLRSSSALRDQLTTLAQTFAARARELQAELAALSDARQVESRSVLYTQLEDLCWRLREDALGNVRRVGEHFAEPHNEKHCFELYRLNIILNNLARLEVRGRDSGGLALVATLPTSEFNELLERWSQGSRLRDWQERCEITDFRHRSIVLGQAQGDQISIAFAYKEAREIGELGANIRALTTAISNDPLVHDLLQRESCQVQIISHNRWASNGIINEANAHPLNQELQGESTPGQPRPRLVLGALNGDIDNYPKLVDRLLNEEGKKIALGITTDAKIVPLEVERRLASKSLSEAVREAVNAFEGSFAIAVSSSTDPKTIALAQRGSGQAIFLGFTGDGGVLYASELYGVVELCEETLQLRGVGSGGQIDGEIALIHSDGKVELCDFTGTLQADYAKRIKKATVTTRDINKGDFPHYLLKEVSEASRSVARTLRGRLQTSDTGAQLKLEAAAIPDSLTKALAERSLQKIFVIGQGTAAIAGQAIADAMNDWLRGSGFRISAMKATELSGFQLDAIGSDTLIVAVSQSGTTTDTNRTVDLAKERGATVIAIVNRRGSDLAAKAHGVLYTSDGRDIEMSVASTKAFYCQVVAGYLLAMELTNRLGLWSSELFTNFAHELAEAPRRLEEVLDQRDTIRAIARSHAGRRRYWAVVGSGPGRIAAEEIRIKLSELCYKSLSADTIEDKKHIDLSAEALIFVCAAGLGSSTASDAVKEVSIFKAHQSLPIVVCDRGETRFARYAAAIIEVPAASPRIALLLTTMVGHLFGYYAALALDDSATPLRRLRELTEKAVSGLDALSPEDVGAAAELRRRYQERAAPLAQSILADLHEGRFESGLPSTLAFRLGDAMRLCLGQLSAAAVQGYERGASHRAQLEVVMAALTLSIDQIRRPIDAIKHQAKTVTVGISREHATVNLEGRLPRALLDSGVAAERLEEAAAATLAAFETYVEAVRGCTVYSLQNLSPLGLPTANSRLKVESKTGVAAQMRSRADAGALLTGTKRMVASAPRVHIGRGASDQRCLLIVPLFENGQLSGLGLIHVDFRANLDARERAQALRLAGRYEELRGLVTEDDSPWSDEALLPIPVSDLLGLAPARLAALLRSS